MNTEAFTNVSPKEIRQIRLKMGLTQSQFARLLHVSLPSVSNWERGKCQPRAYQSYRLIELKNQDRSSDKRSFLPLETENPTESLAMPADKLPKIQFTLLNASGIIDHNDETLSIYDESKGLACRFTLSPDFKKLLLKRLQN